MTEAIVKGYLVEKKSLGRRVVKIHYPILANSS